MANTERMPPLPAAPTRHSQPEPEGQVVDDGDRAALHVELEASLDEAEAGETVDFSAALAELRQRS